MSNNKRKLVDSAMCNLSHNNAVGEKTQQWTGEPARKYYAVIIPIFSAIKKNW